ncbi:Transcriptional regulator containing PAS, AAA-type ATPase, and DNA-binding Fis domains [Hydrocarboniphaga daqingensis]|uniref:Transcriptional regulator containing PAS, AAA-type ATPase, and DNA-binding Fis domains n=1 Tax=Hydrocarboniphaga daqingensis TaxID=490188 RepID=A0A1M5QNE2_9GAMM|nr:sigma 54-interacting transcriptional regulator [Hydrocarboniphaga daqingensis]SHH15401.1 Transcriptional regulator containing PAS, AAA-type ATPase, and DNA-binding Fis domains [Hydrocarboniphaga daqingensis]
MPTAAGSVQALISYLEHDATPMIVLDVEYNILAANTAYQRQFATPRQQVQGQKCFRVSHQYSVPCDQAGEHCPMKQALATRAPDRVLHIHHTPRGPEHVDVELRPILDEGGQVIAYVERLSRVVTASAQPRESGLVGRSESFNAALSALQRAAPSQIPVLLQGESGTGKELFARALHTASPRAGGPLVVVDCTGLSETLFESELFGHERGAFTGAMQRKIGLAETAHGGTLFLDEIGDVPLPMQVKLLRLIESGTFRRVGGVDTLHADFRIVAATHKPLKRMVEDGTFRQDLYYRISAFPVHLPPLRERVDDIALLADSLLQRMAGNDRLRVDDEALAALKRYAFPGNVRELRNLLERARLFADEGVIRLRDLPEDVLGTQAAAALPRAKGQDADKARLSHALATFQGTREELARHLGLSERTLYRRLKDYGLE